ncbi:hypothetical protein VNO78_03956 [Psophocarpus tetragonolobus]|uniref:Uncharacterized protein n=1 Tax=Psophocarpus tetragonolobus TaxID=3891 RepID=A0AAN9T580_PSOTE
MRTNLVLLLAWLLLDVHGPGGKGYKCVKPKDEGNVRNEEIEIDGISAARVNLKGQPGGLRFGETKVIKVETGAPGAVRVEGADRVRHQVSTVVGMLSGPQRKQVPTHGDSSTFRGAERSVEENKENNHSGAPPDRECHRSSNKPLTSHLSPLTSHLSPLTTHHNP